jgi:hypothetical protein
MTRPGLLLGVALALTVTMAGGLLLYDPAPQFIGSGNMMMYFVTDQDVFGGIRCVNELSLSKKEFVEKTKEYLACDDARASPSYRAYLRSIEGDEESYGWNVAVGLGHVLGAEVPCWFTYDRNVVDAFVDRYAPKIDYPRPLFAARSKHAARWAAVGYDSMTPNARAEACGEIARVARDYGFIK